MTLVLVDLASWWNIPTSVLYVVYAVTGIASFISGGGYVLPGMRWYQAADTEG